MPRRSYLSFNGEDLGGTTGNYKRKRDAPFGTPSQVQTVVSATMYDFNVIYGVTNQPFSRALDVIPVHPTSFMWMTPPRATVGTGGNTCNQLGVWAGQSTKQASSIDPFIRNFYAIKLDHPGFNAVDPIQFVQNANLFQYVKLSGVVLEIQFPDPPMVAKQPVTITRPSLITAQMRDSAQQLMYTVVGAPPVSNRTAWYETHPTGRWEYIRIPAQNGSSINLSQIGDYDGWQRLVTLGYKPKVCRGNKYFIKCGTTGVDMNELENIRVKNQNLQATSGVIPPFNTVSGAGLSYNGNTRHKHQKQECDWSVQYASPGQPDNFSGGSMQCRQFEQQGFDTMAFGEAIVFQFLQYAPTCTDDGSPSGHMQEIPFHCTLHNKATFTQLRDGNIDIGQLSSLPIVGGV